VGNWLGTTMFLSHYDDALTQELTSDAGLLVERAEVLQQDNEEAELSVDHCPNTVNFGRKPWP
jgi:hypothetical protein